MSSFTLVGLAAAASWALVFSCSDESSNDGAGGFDSGTLDVTIGTSGEGGASGDGASGQSPDAGHASLLFAFDAGPDCRPVASEETVSAAAAGLPSAGLALWLRADHGVYGATTDGGATEVCAWQDLSGGATVLTNSVPPARPSFIASGIGAQAAVQFGLRAQVLTTGGVLGIGPTSPRTMVAVERLTGTDGRFNPIMQGQGGTGGAYIAIDANTWQTVGSREGVYVTDNSYDTTSTTTGSARIHILTVGATMTVGTAADSAIDYRINGEVQVLSKRQGSGLFEDFSGANFTAVGVFGTPSMENTTQGGLVAEVMVYGRALTLAEQQSIETSLKARYVIP